MLSLILILAPLFIQTESKCLDAEVLRSIGLLPLGEPVKLEHSNLCSELYKDQKTCVDQTHFGKFLSNLYNYVLFKDQAVINSIYDDLKEISNFFIQEQGTLNKLKVAASHEETAAPEEFLFSKQRVIDIRNNIITYQDQCLDSQVKFTLGTFCMLSSDRASDFVLQED